MKDNEIEKVEHAIKVAVAVPVAIRRALELSEVDTLTNRELLRFLLLEITDSVLGHAEE